MKFDHVWKAKKHIVSMNMHIFYIVSQTQFLTELCSSQMTRDTVENLGPAVVQASQQALRTLRQHDLTDSIINSISTGIQQICEGNQLDCVAKAWLIQNKVSGMQKNANKHIGVNSRHTVYHLTQNICEQMTDKKILLRERKRHTDRRVASAQFADLSPERGGGSTPSSSGLGGGTPSSLGQGGHPIQS